MNKQSVGSFSARLASALCGLLGFAVASPAYAVDPVVAGNARIGTHPDVPSPSVAFWKTGLQFSLMTNTKMTFLNAPANDGFVQIQVGQRPMLQLDWTGSFFYIDRLNNPNISVGEPSTATFDAVARIGNHPSYGRGYVGVWLDLPNCGNCGFRDYALLADSENTFLNAPHGGRGTLFFRAGNVDLMSIGASPGQGFQVRTASVFKPGGGSWSALSDERVKRDVATFNTGLEALERIRPVSFRYNGLADTKVTDSKYVGVVAQELEPILPFMVTSRGQKLHPGDKAPTDLKEVDPSAFTYVLINAVKELSAENKLMKSVLCESHPRASFCKGKK
jgi:hypothetical protein